VSGQTYLKGPNVKAFLKPVEVFFKEIKVSAGTPKKQSDSVGTSKGF